MSFDRLPTNAAAAGCDTSLSAYKPSSCCAMHKSREAACVDTACGTSTSVLSILSHRAEPVQRPSGPRLSLAAPFALPHTMAWGAPLPQAGLPPARSTPESRGRARLDAAGAARLRTERNGLVPARWGR